MRAPSGFSACSRDSRRRYQTTTPPAVRPGQPRRDKIEAGVDVIGRIIDYPAGTGRNVTEPFCLTGAEAGHHGLLPGWLPQALSEPSQGAKD
jgi:hypothetical protein